MPPRRPEPRKKPRQARSRALYDAVVTAAADLLERVGTEFTLEAVAARAGVSPGSLYQYFPDRSALVGALVDRQVEQDRGLLAAFRASDFSESDPAQLLVDGVLQLYGQRPALMVHMVALLREVGRESDVHKIIDEFLVVLATVIGHRSKERSPAACHDAARAAIHAVLGIVRAAALHDPQQLRAAEMRTRLVAVARAAIEG